MAKKPILSLLALCASFFSLAVIGLGAFTRLIDAGLGCPDWPGCYGHLMVPMGEAAKQLAALSYPNSHLESYKAWAEMIHRYFVGGLSLFILAIIFLTFIKKELKIRSNIILALCLIALLVYQILLGQMTVTLKLLPIIVSQHLLGGFLILTALWLIYLNNKPVITTTPLSGQQKFLPWAIIALILLLLQICLGAWTSTNYASLSCPDFPFCMNAQSITVKLKEAFNIFTPIGINYEGGVLSDSARQTIQMSHRLGALILTSYFFLLISFAMIRLRHAFDLMKSLYLILGLLIVQLCLGIANVIFKLPLHNAISHNLVAALLLLAMVTFIFKLTPKRQRPL